MLAQAVVAVAASALTLVSASSTSNFSITPSEVELTTRANWCTSETNVCDTVCSSGSKANSCNPSTLAYNCTCTDGTDPDMNEYQNSLPYFICVEAADECIANNAGSSTGQSNCTKSIRDKCGSKTASGSSATTTAASSAKSTSTGTATAASSSAASSSVSTGAGSLPTRVQYLGNGAAAVAVGLMAYML